MPARLSKSEPAHYIKIFIIVVACAAFLSIAYKALILIKNSSFKHETYNLLLLDQNAYLVHIDGASKTLITSKLKDSPKNFLDKSRIEQSAALGVLVDASIIGASSGFKIATSSFMDTGTAAGFIFSRGKFHFNNINEFDILKIFLLSKLIPADNRHEEKGILADLADRKILNEKRSVDIINATGVNGFGSQMAIALRAVGYNVVELETGSEQKSIIRAADDNSDSAQRLKDALRIPFEKINEQGIADITIVLGQDVPKQ